MLVYNGIPEDLFSKILSSNTALLYQSELAHEEKSVENNVKKIANSIGSKVFSLRSDATMYHRDDLPYRGK